MNVAALFLVVFLAIVPARMMGSDGTEETYKP